MEQVMVYLAWMLVVMTVLMMDEKKDVLMVLMMVDL